VTTALVSERLGLAGWSGIILLVAGVMLLSLRGGRELTRLNHKAVRFALFAAVTICAYSVVDGVGARRAGSANAYSVALFVGMGPVMVIYALASRGREVIPAMRRHWRLARAGGTLQLGSYGIAIWAMTVAPIAIVAALRETSVNAGPNCCCKPHINAFPNATKCELCTPKSACLRPVWLMMDWNISR
jgi:drug/metabolite transporter (DMT)-like permease